MSNPTPQRWILSTLLGLSSNIYLPSLYLSICCLMNFRHDYRINYPLRERVNPSILPYFYLSLTTSLCDDVSIIFFCSVSNILTNIYPIIWIYMYLSSYISTANFFLSIPADLPKPSKIFSQMYKNNSKQPTPCFPHGGSPHTVKLLMSNQNCKQLFLLTPYNVHQWHFLCYFKFYKDLYQSIYMLPNLHLIDLFFSSINKLLLINDNYFLLRHFKWV